MFENLYYKHPEYFRYEPVSINEFIESDKYLGKYTMNGESIYPFWKDTLDKLFNHDKDYNSVLFTGGIGTGKTRISIIIFLYYFYNYLSLIDPTDVLMRTKDHKLYFTVYSASFLASKAILHMILTFECFRKILSEFGYDALEPEEITIDTQVHKSYKFGCIRLSLFNDEDDTNKEYVTQRVNIFTLYDDVNVNIKTYYMNNSIGYGRLYNQPFMSLCNMTKSDNNMQFINQFKDCGINSIHHCSYIVDEPQWIIKPFGTFDYNKFSVAYNEEDAFIVDENSVSSRNMLKYSIIDVPMNLKQCFELDIRKSLKYLAGINPFVKDSD